ncbi:Steroid 5 alpha-reductase 3 [Gryganskiella cystojenkinii]|nr:Steroid 5 alpha-reductase 3 [Gryganskiella cystojenkinii]
MNRLRVPKSWFAHFYVLAPLWTIYVSLDLYLFTAKETSSFRDQQNNPPLFHLLDNYYPYFSLLSLLKLLGIMILPSSTLSGTSSSSSPSSRQPLLPLQGWIPPPEILLATFCYLLHGIRRWYETKFIERPSPKATMNLGHYVIGLTFYASMAPTIWVDAYESWAPTTASSGTDLSTVGIVQCLIGLCVFLWGSWHQYNCHVVLANLRSPVSVSASSPSTARTTTTTLTTTTTATEYRVPFGDWFKYLVTPHYSAEMVLYFGFYLMASAGQAAPTMLIAWVWVVVNLGVVARETDQWYRLKFGENYYLPATSVSKEGCSSSETSTTRKRAILVPFVY